MLNDPTRYIGFDNFKIKLIEQISSNATIQSSISTSTLYTSAKNSASAISSATSTAPCEITLFECNFDNSNNTNACDGSFTYNRVTTHRKGVFDYSDTSGTDLKYDVTDYSSISN